MEVKLNMGRIQTLPREMQTLAGQVVQKLAQDTETDIKMNFSSQSPSSPGDPPGVDIGNLKNSVVATPDDSPLTWLLNIGAEYGLPLEFGTSQMAARPFVRPALERTRERAPREIVSMSKI